MKLIVTETILYLSFLGMDIFGIGNSTPIKFVSILILTLSVLDFRDKTVSAALVFTLIADVFLLLLDRWYAAGVLCFLGVQILYAARLQKESRGNGALLSFLLPAAAGLTACGGYGCGLTETLAASYITLFAVNLARACLLAKRTGENKWILFAAGLALFFCCDLCVGLHNMPGTGGPTLQRFAALAMWAFYLPGQVLIRMSAYTEK